MRESRQAAAVDHPNVVSVHEVGNHEGQLFLAMQWIEGTDLNELIGRKGRLPPDQAVRITLQLAGALQAVHDAGLIHRDVKPANVLLRQVGGEDHAYLTDFGVAKPLQAEEKFTKSGFTVGTSGYMAPEQILGREPLPQTDIYALGCVFFRLLTGSAPFPAENDIALAWAHLHNPRPAPVDHPPRGRNPLRRLHPNGARDRARRSLQRWACLRHRAEDLAQRPGTPGDGFLRRGRREWTRTDPDRPGHAAPRPDRRGSPARADRALSPVSRGHAASSRVTPTAARSPARVRPAGDRRAGGNCRRRARRVRHIQRGHDGDARLPLKDHQRADEHDHGHRHSRQQLDGDNDDHPARRRPPSPQQRPPSAIRTSRRARTHRARSPRTHLWPTTTSTRRAANNPQIPSPSAVPSRTIATRCSAPTTARRSTAPAGTTPS